MGVWFTCRGLVIPYLVERIDRDLPCTAHVIMRQGLPASAQYTAVLSTTGTANSHISPSCINRKPMWFAWNLQLPVHLDLDYSSASITLSFSCNMCANLPSWHQKNQIWLAPSHRPAGWDQLIAWCSTEIDNLHNELSGRDLAKEQGPHTTRTRPHINTQDGGAQGSLIIHVPRACVYNKAQGH